MRVFGGFVGVDTHRIATHPWRILDEFLTSNEAQAPTPSESLGQSGPSGGVGIGAVVTDRDGAQGGRRGEDTGQGNAANAGSVNLCQLGAKFDALTDLDDCALVGIRKLLVALAGVGR